MSNFTLFATAIKQQFDIMTQHPLFFVDIPRDIMWKHYLESFPPGTNEIYRERREYDCNHCRNFIKNVGNVVAITDGTKVSVWDVTVPDYYQIVTNAMSSLIKSAPIRDIFIHREAKVGQQSNIELTASGTKTWTHFHCILPQKFVDTDVATRLGKVNSIHSVFKRGLDTIDLESLNIVLDLINQDSIYRGAEHKSTVESFIALKTKYQALSETDKDLFTWANLNSPSARFRNTVIGTLVQDIAEGTPLEDAVKAFESKVAPTNYKRTKALVTTGMIKQAIAKINELGIEPSLPRRYATSEDLSINNVIFADRSTTMSDKSGLEALLTQHLPQSTKSFDKVEEISIEDFIANVVPTATSIEALVQNKHIGNLSSIIAPVNTDAPNILQWDNNFSWSYKGNITDSMKERVKSAGGKVDGVLRFSIQWNENNNDSDNDLDAHCKMPNTHIYYSNSRDLKSGGELDVDIRRPCNKIAVENITWGDLSKMPNGDYIFSVHNYRTNNMNGFTAEIEFNSELHSFVYSNAIPENATIEVAVVTLQNGKFTITPRIPSHLSTRSEWGIQTEQFQKVSTLLLSPNHWDGQSKGNKHYFFMLKDCANPEQARGVYTEFLRNDLVEHRKVFELLGSKMMCEQSSQQLSGLGFSSTQRNELIVKVTGSFTRVLKIKF